MSRNVVEPLLNVANFVLMTLPVTVATDPSSDAAWVQLTAPEQLTADEPRATGVAVASAAVEPIAEAAIAAIKSSLFTVDPFALVDH
jgi:hypothetical protein